MAWRLSSQAKPALPGDWVESSDANPRSGSIVALAPNALETKLYWDDRSRERVRYSTKDCRRSGPHGRLDSELVRAPADRALAGERRQIGPGVECESHPHRAIRTGRVLPAAQGQ